MLEHKHIVDYRRDYERRRQQYDYRAAQLRRAAQRGEYEELQGAPRRRLQGPRARATFRQQQRLGGSAALPQRGAAPQQHPTNWHGSYHAANNAPRAENNDLRRAPTSTWQHAAPLQRFTAPQPTSAPQAGHRNRYHYSFQAPPPPPVPLLPPPTPPPQRYAAPQRVQHHSQRHSLTVNHLIPTRKPVSPQYIVPQPPSTHYQPRPWHGLQRGNEVRRVSAAPTQRKRTLSDEWTVRRGGHVLRYSDNSLVQNLHANFRTTLRRRNSAALHRRRSAKPTNERALLESLVEF